MYQITRKLYSQNFLQSRGLVKKLVQKASISQEDIIVEIGPGLGVITQELINSKAKVFAIEIDQFLYNDLKKKFEKAENLRLYNKDFLKFDLPNYPYKVFANVPFRITSDVIRKVTSHEYLQEAYLIVQKEAAVKFAGSPYDNKNSMAAVLLKPWFNIDIIWNFNKSDFIPKPNIDAVFLRIGRIENPVLSNEDRKLFSNFVISEYSRKKLKQLSIEGWLANFNKFKKYSDKKQRQFVDQTARKFLGDQKKIKKINRTRNDPKWRRYR